LGSRILAASSSPRLRMCGSKRCKEVADGLVVVAAVQAQALQLAGCDRPRDRGGGQGGTGQAIPATSGASYP
jgi:hypothetical protein